MGWLDYASWMGDGDSGGNIFSDVINSYGDDGGSFYDWGTGVGQYTGGSSSGSGWLSALGSLFGGGSSGGSGGGVNWGNALLSGLGSYFTAKESAQMKKEDWAEQGAQQRKTVAFTADLEDYYKQKNKQRKRLALDTYGQFSLTDRYAPNMKTTPAIDVPGKPNPGGY